MKKKVILSSVLTIALCLSLIAGSTFALFTSEQTFNVAVTAGNVKLESKLDDLATTSFGVNTWDEANGTETTFELGGDAVLEENNTKLVLSTMVPGDAATVTIKTENKSDVPIQYHIRMVAEGELAPALMAVAKEKGDDLAFDDWGDPILNDAGEQVYEDVVLYKEDNIFTTKWWTVEAGAAIDDIKLEISFPNDNNHAYQNTFQGKTANIYIQLIAVQGNGTEIYDEGVYVDSASDLAYLAGDLKETWETETFAEMNVGADLDLGATPLVSAEMNPESSKVLYVDANDNTIIADTLVVIDGANTVALTNVNAICNNAIKASSVTNGVLWLSDCNFTLPVDEETDEVTGKVVLCEDGSSPLCVYVCGTITVNGTIITYDNYSDYFDVGTWMYMPGEELELSDLENAR